MNFANFTGLIGIAAVILACYAMSSAKRSIDWRTVIWGLVLQVVFALLIIRGDSIARLFDFLPVSHSIFLGIVAAQILALVLIARFKPALAGNISLVWVKRVVLAQAIVYALKFNAVGWIFEGLKTGATQILKYSGAGAGFVFGVFGSEETMRSTFSSLATLLAAGITLPFPMRRIAIG